MRPQACQLLLKTCRSPPAGDLEWNLEQSKGVTQEVMVVLIEDHRVPACSAVAGGAPPRWALLLLNLG